MKITKLASAPRPDELPAPSAVAAIDIQGLSKAYSRGRRDPNIVIDNVSLTVAPAEFVVLLGPSGCGKTTLLRCVAGLSAADSGQISIGGSVAFCAERRVWVPPERRNIGFMFQSYALWPHMTVLANVAYPLRCRRVRRQESGERAHEMLERVGCGELSERYPGQLSGGQQQRVALARALVCGEKILLFDEPLSNVDAQQRQRLRIELLTIQQELGFAALYVTHDQEEALSLAHRIVVLRQGRIAQQGRPREVYENPDSRYVGEFIGIGNEQTGKLAARTVRGQARLLCGIGEVQGVLRGEAAADRGGESDTAEYAALFRPEQVELSAAALTGVNAWPGRVIRAMFMGSYVEYLVEVGGGVLRCWRSQSLGVAPGHEVWARVDPAHVHVFRSS